MVIRDGAKSRRKIEDWSDRQRDLAPRITLVEYNDKRVVHSTPTAIPLILQGTNTSAPEEKKQERRRAEENKRKQKQVITGTVTHKAIVEYTVHHFG